MNFIFILYFEHIYRYKLDVFGNKKATMKLLTECVKLKKLMAANTNRLPINIECFMDDKDVSGHMDRAKFEELIASHLADIERVMGEVLTASKLKPEEIYRYTFISSFVVCIFNIIIFISVEIVGGSTRIPAIKALIEKVFGKESSTTLNADEAVSRGCALQCAILSPVFKVGVYLLCSVPQFAFYFIYIIIIGVGARVLCD